MAQEQRRDEYGRVEREGGKGEEEWKMRGRREDEDGNNVRRYVYSTDPVAPQYAYGTAGIGGYAAPPPAGTGGTGYGGAYGTTGSVGYGGTTGYATSPANKIGRGHHQMPAPAKDANTNTNRD